MGDTRGGRRAVQTTAKQKGKGSKFHCGEARMRQAKDDQGAMLANVGVAAERSPRRHETCAKKATTRVCVSLGDPFGFMRV